MPAGIQHEATPGKPRLVFNLYTRNSPRNAGNGVRTECSRRKQLEQSLRAIENSGRLRSADDNRVLGRTQLITLLAKAWFSTTRREHNSILSFVVVFVAFDGQLEACHSAKLGGKELCRLAGGRICNNLSGLVE